MLCDKCLNKTICKYYDFLINAPMIVNIEYCEKINIKSTQPETMKNPNDNVKLLKFKEPIDYSKLDIPKEEDTADVTSFEQEERIIVDLFNHEEIKSCSITDILIGGNDDNEEEN